MVQVFSCTQLVSLLVSCDSISEGVQHAALNSFSLRSQIYSHLNSFRSMHKYPVPIAYIAMLLIVFGRILALPQGTKFSSSIFQFPTAYNLLCSRFRLCVA